MNSNTSLLLYALVGVVGLVVLIARFKVNSFIALIVASLFVGVTSGMEFRAIATAFQDGMGAVLGSIAAVVGLGIVLGKMLEVSGGARVVASTLIERARRASAAVGDARDRAHRRAARSSSPSVSSFWRRFSSRWRGRLERRCSAWAFLCSPVCP